VKHAFVSVVLVFGSIASIASIAQEANHNAPKKLDQYQASGLMLEHSASPYNCPVFLRARRGGRGDLLEVGDARPKGIAQGLSLTVADGKARQVMAVNVTVRGFSDRGRMVQTRAQTLSLDSASASGSWDAARTLDVKFLNGAGTEASRFVWVPGMTAVAAIDLNSASFADGSAWKIADGSVCRVFPDPMMLVENR